MRRKGLSKQKRLKLSLFSSLLIVLTIPLVLFALISSDSFDLSSSASKAQNCSFEFIYVNPESVEAGSTLQLKINGEVFEPDEKIESVTIVDIDGTKIFSNTYAEPSSKLTETFIYQSKTTPSSTQILGTLKSNLAQYPCSLLDTTSNKVTTLAANLAPEFRTDPVITARPSNVLKINESYTYQLEAVDVEGDNIEYSYSFTPGANWLGMSVVSDGTGGDLKLNFSGAPTVPESYMANVFIHDGYTDHLRSQSWVISVEQGENDIPVVTVSEPVEGSRVARGTILRISWNATDLNQIVQYKLYYASNPGNQSSWVAIDENLSYEIGHYLLDTTSIPEGSYKIIVQAVDNQSPAAVGTGISGTFGIDKKPEPIPDPGTNPNPDPDDDDDNDPEPDDGVRLDDPQVINISPESGSKVTNNRRTISATLIASKEGEIVKDSVLFKLDGKDLSNKLEFNEISEYEINVIYKPTEDLANGEHKVEISFTDSEDKDAERKWSFTVEGESDEDHVTIFGYKIPKRIAIIIAAGLFILLLALIIPWLLYLAWRNSDEDQYDVYSSNDVYVPPARTNLTSNSTNTTYSSAVKPNSYTPPPTNSTIYTNATRTTTSSTQPVQPAREPIVALNNSTSSTNSKPVAVNPSDSVTKTTVINSVTPTNKPINSTTPTQAYRYPDVSNNTATTQPKPIVNSINSNTSLTTQPKSPTTEVKTEVIVPKQDVTKPVTVINNTPPSNVSASNPTATPSPIQQKAVVTPIAYPPKASANLTEAKPNNNYDRRDEIIELAESLKAAEPKKDLKPSEVIIPPADRPPVPVASVTPAATQPAAPKPILNASSTSTQPIQKPVSTITPPPATPPIRQGVTQVTAQNVVRPSEPLPKVTPAEPLPVQQKDVTPPTQQVRQTPQVQLQQNTTSVPPIKPVSPPIKPAPANNNVSKALPKSALRPRG